ncbi:hypothetical protein [Prevotella sp. KH2C16]|uniref:hypothetical protein n=1 Tax=Prevotella sp. KH2C16 TaxID=1855325 RepID=UPI0008E823D7|nr:hypothetical protein [Prevotella sp. KH2C16]SFG42067.1 hypothetical protein SAMN05216383_11346 [Prevotella sp. KH2C16]
MKTFLHGLLLWSAVALALLVLADCVLRFDTREEVLEYLKKEFPGQKITLQPKYKTRRGWTEDWRVWTFTLSGYPKDTFRVASHIKSYPVPMLKTERHIITDFDKVVVLRCEQEFEQGPLRTFDAPTRRLWSRFPRGGFSLRAARWEVETVDDIWRAKRLIDAFEAWLAKEGVDRRAYYYLRMYMQGHCYALGGGGMAMNIMDGLEESKPGSKSPHYLEYGLYGQADRRKVCQKFYNSVMEYHQLMADGGNGVTDANLQAWNEEQLQLSRRWPEMTEAERDSLRGLFVGGDGDVRNVFLDTGQKPFLLAVWADSDMRPASRGIYITYPQLRELCLRSGLRVQGGGDHFTVRGVDGNRYEFSTAFYREKPETVGFLEDTCFYRRNGRAVILPGFWTRHDCVNDGLVRRITGLNLRQMVVHGTRNEVLSRV